MSDTGAAWLFDPCGDTGPACFFLLTSFLVSFWGSFLVLFLTFLPSVVVFKASLDPALPAAIASSFSFCTRFSFRAAFFCSLSIHLPHVKSTFSQSVADFPCAASSSFRHATCCQTLHFPQAIINSPSSYGINEDRVHISFRGNQVGHRTDSSRCLETVLTKLLPCTPQRQSNTQSSSSSSSSSSP